jgi:CheY-like chemotaxis protein
MLPPCSILIVEDDPAIGAVMAEMLQEEGYRTLLAANGADALAVLDQTRACVILLDLMMPVMNGMGFRAIQRATPHLASIPVVVLSASPVPAATAAMLDAAAYLRKPVKLEQLLATVEQWCPA